MPTLLAISPHLDDAVFSAGGTLAARARDGWTVVIATCFTGNVAKPRGFALACQLDKGLSADVDYMALRRAEDVEACAILGARPLHLPLLEAPHRGYPDAGSLFGPRHPDDATIERVLGEHLIALVVSLRPNRVLAPAAIGNHVDHWVVRDAVAALARESLIDPAAIRLWTDWPYADRTVMRPGETPEIVPLSAVDISAKIDAAGAYVTQIGFQFGSRETMAKRLAEIGSETFWSLATI